MLRQHWCCSRGNDHNVLVLAKIELTLSLFGQICGIGRSTEVTPTTDDTLAEYTFAIRTFRQLLSIVCEDGALILYEKDNYAVFAVIYQTRMR